jgi:hypothetical protein
MANTTLEGPKVLLIGPAGTGKSRALATLIEWAEVHKRRVMGLYTENSLETVLRYFSQKGKPLPDNFYYHVARDKATPFKDLLQAAKDVGNLNYESLTKLQDPNRGKNNPYHKILNDLADFPDDRTGKKLGNFGEWSNEDIFFIDSFSELANAAVKMTIGTRPVMSQPEYQVAQNNLLNFLRFCTQGFLPTFVMTAHVQRQVNEAAGTTKLMVKAIGKAIGDDIPQLFSEVIGCVRVGDQWYWDTADSQIDTKVRYLPVKSKIDPNFALIMDQWEKARTV